MLVTKLNVIFFRRKKTTKTVLSKLAIKPCDAGFRNHFDANSPRTRLCTIEASLGYISTADNVGLHGADLRSNFRVAQQAVCFVLIFGLWPLWPMLTFVSKHYNTFRLFFNLI